MLTLNECAFIFSDVFFDQDDADRRRSALASRHDRPLRVLVGVLRERDHVSGGGRRHSKLVRVRVAPERGDQIARAKKNGSTHDRGPVTVAR